MAILPRGSDAPLPRTERVWPKPVKKTYRLTRQRTVV